MFDLHSSYTISKLRKLISSADRANPPCDFTPQKGNFLYVPASCLPFHISGYTKRTHEILKSLKTAFVRHNEINPDAQQKLFVLTRTGYPWDRLDSLEYPESESNVIDGITYDHLRSPRNFFITAMYVAKASKRIEEYIIKNRISCVHAASNHVNALPALIAAKRLGIPFQYEMRGLWELTRISRDPKFVKSHNFKLGLSLEAMVATNADKVFVISEQLSEYIRNNWKVSPSVIRLLPNCADVEIIKPKDKADNEAEIGNLSGTESNDFPNGKPPVTIVYAGSLIVYEGIQTLLKAMSVLVHDEHLQVRLEILGDGEYRKALEYLSAELKLQNHVFFHGMVTPDEAERKQDDCSLVCIPREPFEVCRIVPPIKLVEAMAKEKCVIVPDLPVFRDELGLGDSGCLFFKSGDFHDLARVLKENIYDAEGLREKGRKARQYVINHRQWNQFTGEVYS